MAGELVLVVDDSPTNLKLARLVLERAGFSVETADTGEAALRAVAEKTPACILMDLQLPDMDGLEITRRLKAAPETHAIPILAVTAFAMKGDEDRAKGAGCDGYVSKPIDTRTLAETVARYILRR